MTPQRAVPGQKRSAWPRLAGVLLVIDGIGALVLSAIVGFMSLLPPVAAIQGQPPEDQTMFGPALGLFVVAIACLWAARQALARVRSARSRRARVLGIVAAIAILAFGGTLPFTSGSLDSGEVVMLAALLLIQGLIIAGLLRWPAHEPGAVRP